MNKGIEATYDKMLADMSAVRERVNTLVCCDLCVYWLAPRSKPLLNTPPAARPCMAVAPVASHPSLPMMEQWDGCSLWQGPNGETFADIARGEPVVAALIRSEAVSASMTEAEAAAVLFVEFDYSEEQLADERGRLRMHVHELLMVRAARRQNRADSQDV